MTTTTKTMIETAISLDPTIDGDRAKMALDILNGLPLPKSADETREPEYETPGRLLTCADAAKWLGVTTQCLRNWREEGLPAVVPPGSTKAIGYWEQDLREFLSPSRRRIA